MSGDSVNREPLPGYLAFLRGGPDRLRLLLLTVEGPAILAADLDGTLVSRAGDEPRQEVVEALLDVARAGVIFVACTGRPAAVALNTVQDLGVERGYVVAFGGAQTIELTSGRILDELVLPAELERETRRLSDLLGLESESYRSGAGTLRIVLSGRPRMIGRAAVRLQHRDCARATLLRPSPEVLGVQHPDAHKQRALAQLAARVGVSRSHIAYIGDGPDDASALSWSGLGVVVANGSEEARASADCSVAAAFVPHLLSILAATRKRYRETGDTATRGG